MKRRFSSRALLLPAVILLAGFFQLSSVSSAVRHVFWSVGGFSPLQETRASFAQWIGVFSELTTLREIREREATVREENEALKNGLSGLEQENRELRSVLGIPEQKRPEMLIARILWQDTFLPARLLVVDQGFDDGVVVGMPAMLASGKLALGTVIEVFSHSALVRLLGDPATKVSVQFGGGNIFGLARGEGAKLRYEFVSEDAPLEPGMPVFTAGHDRFFPQGLFLGWIEDIREGQGGFQQGVITLAGKPEELTMLLLLPSVHP